MKKRAFTLIELLVVVGILTALLAILLPNLANARASARTTVCAANLRSLGLGTTMYADENNGDYFRYYLTLDSSSTLGPGRLWWFGFETSGPGSGTNRPLDKSASPLAPYTASLDSRLQCPDFPYSDGAFFPKFNQHAASYGYNTKVGPQSLSLPATRRLFPDRLKDIVAFADAVHFDFGSTFNEAHYLQYIPSATTPSGYAHFRHPQKLAGLAQLVYLDGHVDSQPLSGPTYKLINNSPTGNLTSPENTNTIYGF